MTTIDDGAAFPLDTVAALGGRAIDRDAAATAIAARVAAVDGLAAMRAVSLPLIDAVEPSHHGSRLERWVPPGTSS